MDERALEIGRTYFSLMYADDKLAIPLIDTLIYLGPDQTDSGDSIHLFQHAWSHHNEGNWNQMSPEQQQEYEEAPLVSFPVGNIEPICDGDELLEQLSQWRSRSK